MLASSVLAFLGVSALVIVTPGPDTAVTVRNALLGGRAGGIFTALGVSVGQAVWACASRLGIVALLVASEPLFLAVKYAGAAYLVWLGLLGVMAALATGQPWLLMLCQVLIGAGFGISWAFLSQAVMEAARPGERDSASALLPTLQSGGYAVGAAVAGLIANEAGMAAALAPDAIVHAATWVFGIAALLGTLGFLASFGVRPGGR